MKHLLDVNVLLAGIWTHHSRHMGIPMEKARAGLAAFRKERDAGWIAADLPALDSRAKTPGQVTDHYLADLAAKHGHKLATLAEGMKHPSVGVIR